MSFRMKLAILWLCLSPSFFAMGQPCALDKTGKIRCFSDISSVSLEELRTYCKEFEKHNLGTYLREFKILQDVRRQCSLLDLELPSNLQKLKHLRARLQAETTEIAMDFVKWIEKEGNFAAREKMLTRVGFGGPIVNDLFPWREESFELYKVLQLVDELEQRDMEIIYDSIFSLDRINKATRDEQKNYLLQQRKETHKAQMSFHMEKIILSIVLTSVVGAMSGASLYTYTLFSGFDGPITLGDSLSFLGGALFFDAFILGLNHDFRSYIVQYQLAQREIACLEGELDSELLPNPSNYCALEMQEKEKIVESEFLDTASTTLTTVSKVGALTLAAGAVFLAYTRFIHPWFTLSYGGLCPICLDEFRVWNPPHVFACGHGIHNRACLAGYLEAGYNTCPTCRAEL